MVSAQAAPARAPQPPDVDLDDLRSAVTVSRAHPSDVGERHVVVRLDEGRKVHLAFGQLITVDVEPGRHRLRVHNTLFWKTIDFVIEPGEHLEFVTINSARWWTAGVAGVLGAAPLFLAVERRSRR
jgi:hypothetical protein